MVEISEINDRDSLEAWLKALPQDTEAEQAEARRVAVSIAARAAARVVPVYWHWALTSKTARDRDLTALPVLRSVLISAVAALVPTADIRKAARAAALAAAAYAADAAALAAAAADAAARAAADSADAAATAASAASAASAAYAASAAAAWEAVRRDCAVLAAGRDVFAEPLWVGEAPFVAEWAKIQAEVAKADHDWGFWVAWYAQMLDPKGRAPNWAMLERIALIPAEVWDGPVDAALAAINEIWAGYAIAATPNGERIVEDDDSGKLRIEATTKLGPDHLEHIRVKMLEAARIFDGEGGENGPYGGLASEIAVVTRAADLQSPRPVQLYDACRRAARRTRVKRQNEYCPNDELVEDFVTQLEESALDLMGLNEDVREVATYRARTRLDEAPPERAETLEDAAEEIADLSEGDLHHEIKSDAREATDADALPEERKEALYRFTSRMLRIYQGAKKVLSEANTVTKDVAGISKNIAVVVASSAAIKTAVQYLLSLF